MQVMPQNISKVAYYLQYTKLEVDWSSLAEPSTSTSILLIRPLPAWLLSDLLYDNLFTSLTINQNHISRMLSAVSGCSACPIQATGATYMLHVLVVAARTLRLLSGARVVFRPTRQQGSGVARYCGKNTLTPADRHKSNSNSLKYKSTQLSSVYTEECIRVSCSEIALRI